MTKFLNEDWMKKNGYIDESTKKEEKKRIQQWDGAKIRVRCEHRLC